MTYIIASSLIAGVLFGHFILPDTVANVDLLMKIALNILLLAVGIDIGWNKKIFSDIRRKGFKILFVPLSIIIGSLIGSLIAGMIFKFPYNTSLAIGAGFGWYSLSGILLTDMANIEIGMIAFLSNVFREFFAILLIPIIARKLNYITAIAPAGATSMDTTLPIIVEETDEETGIISFVNGVVLSFFVPILVPFLYNL